MSPKSPCDTNSIKSSSPPPSFKSTNVSTSRKTFVLFLSCLHMTTTKSVSSGSLRTKLLRNRRGRRAYLLLTALFGALALGMLMTIIWKWRSVVGNGFGISAVALLGVSALWTLILSMSHGVFRLRGLNTLLLLTAAIAGSVCAAKCTVHAVFLLLAIPAYLLLFVHALLQIPSSQSRIAYHLHPFVDDRIYSRPFATTPRSMHHRQRALSVFRDWPAPQPFPAKALYTYGAKSPSELSFVKKDDLTILDCRGNWWQARHPVGGGVGFVPSNFIAVVKKAKVVRNFTAAGPDEVCVLEGQVVEVMEEHESMSLVRGVDARIGSVDSVCLQVIQQEDSAVAASGEKENVPPPKMK